MYGGLRNSSTLFRMVPSQPPTASPSPKLGVYNPTENCNLKFRANECGYVKELKELTNALSDGIIGTKALTFWEK